MNILKQQVYYVPPQTPKLVPKYRKQIKELKTSHVSGWTPSQPGNTYDLSLGGLKPYTVKNRFELNQQPVYPHSKSTPSFVQTPKYPFLHKNFKERHGGGRVRRKQGKIARTQMWSQPSCPLETREWKNSSSSAAFDEFIQPLKVNFEYTSGMGSTKAKRPKALSRFGNQESRVGESRGGEEARIGEETMQTGLREEGFKPITERTACPNNVPQTSPAGKRRIRLAEQSLGGFQVAHAAPIDIDKRMPSVVSQTHPALSAEEPRTSSRIQLTDRQPTEILAQYTQSQACDCAIEGEVPLPLTKPATNHEERSESNQEQAQSNQEQAQSKYLSQPAQIEMEAQRDVQSQALKQPLRAEASAEPQKDQKEKPAQDAACEPDSSINAKDIQLRESQQIMKRIAARFQMLQLIDDEHEEAEGSENQTEQQIIRPKLGFQPLSPSLAQNTEGPPEQLSSVIHFEKQARPIPNGVIIDLPHVSDKTSPPTHQPLSEESIKPVQPLQHPQLLDPAESFEASYAISVQEDPQIIQTGEPQGKLAESIALGRDSPASQEETHLKVENSPDKPPKFARHAVRTKTTRKAYVAPSKPTEIPPSEKKAKKRSEPPKNRVKFQAPLASKSPVADLTPIERFIHNFSISLLKTVNLLELNTRIEQSDITVPELTRVLTQLSKARLIKTAVFKQAQRYQSRRAVERPNQISAFSQILNSELRHHSFMTKILSQVIRKPMQKEIAAVQHPANELQEALEVHQQLASIFKGLKVTFDLRLARPLDQAEAPQKQAYLDEDGPDFHIDKQMLEALLLKRRFLETSRAIYASQAPTQETLFVAEETELHPGELRNKRKDYLEKMICRETALRKRRQAPVVTIGGRKTLSFSNLAKDYLDKMRQLLAPQCESANKSEPVSFHKVYSVWKSFDAAMEELRQVK